MEWSTENRCKEDDIRQRVEGRQTNHAVYYLPACLSHLQNPPLWLAVARWGLLIGEMISRNDIAQAFHISLRRAADIMTYITCERQDVVKATKCVSRTGHGRRTARIMILAISEASLTSPSQSAPAEKSREQGCAAAKKTAGAQAETELRQIRQFFLRQRYRRDGENTLP
ncbi:CaiF/GrlA family transcriptional regulator [Citrobacter amalonaticus]|nr:CaiF/GrlA family transcriptional regulator [Citrobacter amalonaticus]